MNNTSKAIVAYTASVALFFGSAFADIVLGSILLGIAVFVAVYTFIMGVNLARDPFRHEPATQIVKKNVTVTHDHRHFNIKEMTEGNEIHQTLKDGTSVTYRNVKKWK